MAGLGQDSTTVWNARDPGTYAWNHSVAAALALALCGLYEPDPVLRGSLLDFGMLRLQKFFEHGINDWGIPYEGFSYCGVSLRVIGLFGLLIAREPQRMKAYQGLRGAYSGKLARLLEWIDGATFPSGKFLISYNQSEYSASLAVAGLLLFFGDSDPDKAVFLWSKLAGDSVDGLHGDTTDLARSCAFEAMFFISKPVPEDCPFTPDVSSRSFRWMGLAAIRAGASRQQNLREEQYVSARPAQPLGREPFHGNLGRDALIPGLRCRC
jgi:hypothetical protein